MLLRFASLLVALMLTLIACGGDVADEPSVTEVDRYQVEVEALDALVFTHLPLNEGFRNVISMSFGHLADKIIHLEHSRRARGSARSFRQLSKQVRKDNLSQADLRQSWLTLRKSVFGYADWFRYVDPATGQRLLRPPRPADLVAAQRVLESLEELIAEACRDIAGLGGPRFDGDSERISQAYLQSWSEWADSWPAAVDEVMRDLPEAPDSGVDLNYCVAYARLKYAAVNLKAAVTTNWAMPFQPVTEEHFGGAMIHLDFARESLWTLAANGE